MRSLLGYPRQDAFDPLGGKAYINFYRQGFSIKVINDIERPKTTPTKQTVTHKIDRPTAIDGIRYGKLNWISIRQSLLATAPLI